MAVRSAIAAALAASVSLAACSPLMKQQNSAPQVVDLGSGQVTEVSATTVDNGESRGARVAVGLLSGGLAGAAFAASTEEDMGTSRLKHYVIDMEQGADLTANSFSHADVGDCVKVTRVSGSAQVILERMAQVPEPPAPLVTEASLSEPATPAACGS